MVKGDTQIGIDFYDFRVRLKNDGELSAREFRIEVEIPEEFLPRGGTTYTLEVQNHNRRGVRLFRATEKSWPGTIFGSHFRCPGKLFALRLSDEGRNGGRSDSCPL